MRILIASSGFALALSTLRGLLALRVLDPVSLGIWKTLMLLLPVVGWIRLSVSQGMVTRVPVLIGERRGDDARDVAEAAGWVQILNGALFGLLTFGASFFVAETWRLPMQLMALVLIASQAHNFYRDVIIAWQDSPGRARGLLIASATDVVCSIGLAALWGLPGLAVGTLLGLVLPAAYLASRAPRLRLHCSRQALAGLWCAGWRVAAVDIAQTAMRYADVAMVAWLGGPVAAGLYALSQMVAEAGTNLSRVAISEVVGPRVLRQAGADGALHDAGPLAMALARRLTFILPPVLALASLMIEPVVGTLLPQYAPGVPAARVMIWAVLFGSLQAAAQPLLVAAGRLSESVVLAVVLLPLSAAAQYVFWQTGSGLAGVAAVSVATSAVVAVASVWRAAHICDDATSRRQLVTQC